MTYTIDQITRIGGREWQKGSHHRVYLHSSVWAPLIDLEITTHKTGNVRNATLGGEHISNRSGSNLRSASVYLDAVTGQIVTDLGERADRDYHDGDALVAALTAGIAGLVRASEPTPAPAEVTVTEAAAKLGVSRSTIYRRIKAGKIAAVKNARGHWLVTL